MLAEQVLFNIENEIEKAEIDILYYKDKADLIRKKLDGSDFSQEIRESLERLHTYALRKVQEIRLAQLLALEQHSLMMIVQSN